MIEVHQPLRTLLAAILAFSFGFYFQREESYWILLSALLLVQIRVSGYFGKTFLTILICGSFIAINAIIGNILAYNHYLLAFFLSLVTFLCVYVGLRYSTFLIPAFFINVCTAIASGMDVTFSQVLTRSNNILIGMLIAVLTSLLIWPPRLKSDFKAHVVTLLSALNQLQIKIFKIYLARDYAEKHYVHEKELHELRMDVLEEMQNIRDLVVAANASSLAHHFAEIADKLNQLIELIIAMGNLRYRVQDHATFEVCEKEFRAISQKMSEILLKNADATGLLSYIQALEEVNRNTLGIVSKEPIDFFIFIQNLNAIYEVLSLLKMSS